MGRRFGYEHLTFLTTMIRKKQKDDEIMLMNGIKSTSKENGSFNDPDQNKINVEKETEKQLSIKPENDKKETGFTTMSPLQKFFFVLSLLLSVLYVVAFAWLIPCQKITVINSTDIEYVAEEWKLKLPGLSLSSNIELIRELNNSILIFGYDKLGNQSAVSGLIAIHAIEGKKLWERPLLSVPKYLKCYLNFENFGQCLVVGDEGYISSVNATTGELYWTSKPKYDLPIFEIASVPAMVPDCDEDGVLDLAVAFSLYNSTDDNSHPERISIGILSGQTGKEIGSRTIITQCVTKIDRLQLWGKDADTLKSYILFFCTDKNGKGNIWQVSANHLCRPLEKVAPEVQFTKVLTVNQPKDKQFTILYQSIEKLDTSIQDMLIVWNNGNIIKLDGETRKKIWSSSDTEQSDIKAILTGHFNMNKNEQLAVISSHPSLGTTINIFDISNGNKLMNLINPNYTATSAVHLPAFFDDIDGIMIKHINLISDNVLQPTGLPNPSIKEMIAEEEYIIISCNETQSFIPVIKERIKRSCYDNSVCRDVIFSTHATAVFTNTDSENFKELIMVTTTILSDDNNTYHGLRSEETTIVRSINIENVFTSNNSSKQSC